MVAKMGEAGQYEGKSTAASLRVSRDALWGTETVVGSGVLPKI
jgi:hypothetical protein